MYEDYLRWPPVSGTYIFSDLERLTDAQVSVFRDCADRLEKSFPEALIINHPKHAMRRFKLLNVASPPGAASRALRVACSARRPCVSRYSCALHAIITGRVAN